MKWWGALSCLLVTQGLAQGPQGSPAPQCHVRCMQVYSGHHSEFHQVSPSLGDGDGVSFILLDLSVRGSGSPSAR